MHVTVYECDNGWAAVYDEVGKRIDTFRPHDHARDYGRHHPHHHHHHDPPEPVHVKVVRVHVDPRYKDFPVKI